jgi:hypothetical protein
MELNSILQTIGTIITLSMAGFMLWRAKKMLPSEQAGGDAGAAKQYAEAAKLAAEQVTGALKRIDELEKRYEKLEEKFRNIQDTLVVRDKLIIKLNEELFRRDALIEDWNKGIKTLIAQLVAAKITPVWIPRAWGVIDTSVDRG